MKLVGLILCCVFLQIFNGSPIGAAPVVNWSIAEPSVFKNEVASYSPNAYCPTYSQTLQVENIPEPQELCIFSADRFSIATGFIGQLGWRAAISYSYDNIFHVIDGVCVNVAGCLYAPETDTLVERYRTGQNFLGVNVFKNVQDRIDRVFDSTSGTLRYDFDRSRPDYTITGEDSLILPIGSIALSNNGEWLGFEIANVGIGRMNIVTGEKLRLEASGVTYGMGFDPIMELAISDNGAKVAVMGEGMDIRVIEVIEGCGHTLDPLVFDAPLVSLVPCPMRPINRHAFVDYFYAAFHPTFDRSGGQLTFYVMSYGSPIRRVSLRATNYQANTGLDYLAMGDSFSSGEGESEDAQYLQGTNDPHEKCHVSRRSYPFLIAAKLGTSVKSVACAGAVVADITGNSNAYQGQKNRLGPAGMNLTKLERELSQARALDAFIPGRIQQGNFLSEYEPKLLTVGIGGNDAGFMAKLKTCAMPSRCEWASSQEMIHRTGLEIQSLFDRLVTMYQELKRRSPNTKIVAVGYPEVIDVDEECDPITGFLLDRDERVFMQEGLRYLNRVIRTAALRAQIVYGDIEDAFSGSRLCGGGQAIAMNGLRLGDDISLLSVLPMLKIIGNESFHPNPYGHFRIAHSLHDRYGDLFSYDCLHSCSAQDSLTLSGYWMGDTVGAVTQRAQDLTYSDNISRDALTLTIDIPRFSFKPNASIQFEIHSNIVQLGELQSDEFGAVNGELVIPRSIAEGYHALHALGPLYDLRPGDLYQGISYGTLTKSNELEQAYTTETVNSVDKVATTTEMETRYSSNLGPLLKEGEVLGTKSELPPNSTGVRVNHHPKLNMTIVLLLISVLGILVVLLLIIRRRQKKASQDRGG